MAFRDPTHERYISKGAEPMTYNEQQHELDAETVILGLGCAIGLLVLIGWIVTSVA